MSAYWYAVGEDRLGPVSLEQMAGLRERGVLQRDTLVWRAGLATWTRAESLDELGVGAFPPPLPHALPPVLPVPPVPPPVPPPVATVGEVDATDAADVRTFVGKRYDYFATKWAIAEKRRNRSSWNWAAFFIGLAWMSYRKMYLYSWIFIGAVVVESICEYAFGFPERLSSGINIGIAVLFGLQGNHWYRLHVEKKVREITALNTPAQAQVELARQGGTNIGAAIGFLLAFVVVMCLVVFVAER